MTTVEKQKIAVIGAGIIGTMSAWQLAKRGFDVTVFEQWNSPNDRGASAGESRIFRTIYKEGPQYVPILKKSHDLWQELEHNQSSQVLQMCGGLMIGHPDQADVAAVISCAQSADLDHRVLDATDMSAEFPQYRLDDDEVGVFDPASGVFRPEAAVLSARKEAERLGAVFHPYTRALNIRSHSTAVMIDTQNGAQAFDKVVVSTGPWANELTGFDHKVLTPQRLVALWFLARDVPLHAPEHMPVSIRRHAEGGFSCFPALDGLSVKILPHHLAWTELDTVEDLPRFIEPDFVRAAERAVARLMPGLEPIPIRVSTWTEGFTVDETPILGPIDADPRIILAVGMSGQGFKFSPMMGSIVTDMVESGTSADTLAAMDANRFEGSRS
ncbi:N-methyl-L-tryptophan oxidase [Brevibacterium sp. UCMA 11754]|uniref:N-methyl-L-tryptophan oxidase n=1 Tax=Brevibacterium sp. UCMA 11754 TaxID=2749198 RepID=UPI001F346D28|nr:N-methyl-L-tryptophan oxidase [Brevibacterium sp. UCMA 11754]